MHCGNPSHRRVHYAPQMLCAAIVWIVTPCLRWSFPLTCSCLLQAMRNGQAAARGLTSVANCWIEWVRYYDPIRPTLASSRAMNDRRTVYEKSRV